MTRNETLLGLAAAITQADRARHLDRKSDLLSALDRRILDLRRDLARLDYPPELAAESTARVLTLR